MVGLDKDGIPAILSWITLAVPPSPLALGNTVPLPMTTQLFTSMQQIPCVMKNLDSEQSRMPCPCLPHIMQYMTECILGGKPLQLPAHSPSCNSNHLNHAAKSSIFDWMFSSGFTAFSSVLDSLDTLLSLMGLSHLLPLDLGLMSSSSSDDSDSFSEGKLEDSELESSTDSSSLESAKCLFCFQDFAKCPLRFASHGW